MPPPEMYRPAYILISLPIMKLPTGAGEMERKATNQGVE
ncbi:hypothetical protein ANRL2_04356 [Anaerolineae bacterium]|nr:hypothetical protein ANRL2_04356 [Anaerolineae bacterium]